MFTISLTLAFVIAAALGFRKWLCARAVRRRSDALHAQLDAMNAALDGFERDYNEEAELFRTLHHSSRSLPRKCRSKIPSNQETSNQKTSDPETSPQKTEPAPPQAHNPAPNSSVTADGDTQPSPASSSPQKKRPSKGKVVDKAAVQNSNYGLQPRSRVPVAPQHSQRRLVTFLIRCTWAIHAAASVFARFFSPVVALPRAFTSLFVRKKPPATPPIPEQSLAM
jgi:type II secretory pathway pseudopilin PulG